MQREAQLQQLLRARDTVGGDTRRDGRAVDERRGPRLGSGASGSSRMARQRAVRIERFAADINPVLAIHAKAAHRRCRQGHEIATGADRTQLKDMWQRIGIQKCDEALDDF